MAITERCEECGAMLTPRGPDVPPEWLHVPMCSKYIAPRVGNMCAACGAREGDPHAVGCTVMKAFASIKKAHMMDITRGEVWVSSSGASSSEQVAPFHLIPLVGLEALANRFGAGLPKHGRDNYMKAVRAQDIAWMADRINHGIKHALLWLLEQEGYLPASGDDHAGAVAWLGTVMAVYGAEAAKRGTQGSAAE